MNTPMNRRDFLRILNATPAMAWLANRFHIDAGWDEDDEYFLADEDCCLEPTPVYPFYLKTWVGEVGPGQTSTLRLDGVPDNPLGIGTFAIAPWAATDPLAEIIHAELVRASGAPILRFTSPSFYGFQWAQPVSGPIIVRPDDALSLLVDSPARIELVATMSYIFL